VNKAILISVVLAMVASSCSFSMMMTRETEIEYEKRLTNAAASVVRIPELVQYIQKCVDQPVYALRATCQAIKSAIKVPKLEELRLILNGEKYLRNADDERAKVKLSHRLSAKDDVLARGLCHKDDFLSDGTFRWNGDGDYLVCACIQNHCSKKEGELEELMEQITQYNNAVKKAAYLAISCEDIESLGKMLRNLDIPKSTADKYCFYRDLVVYAIDRNCYKSFEYLIQANPYSLNNYRGNLSDPIYMMIGPITKDVKAACISKGEEAKLLAFCQKNGCEASEQVQKKLNAKNNSAQKGSDNHWCTLS
jgi:hypothetical protein